MLWGKNVTIITKRVNTKHLYNRKLDIYEKCCTFDGPEIYSEKGNILFWKNIRITIKKGFLTGTLSTEIMNTSNKIVEVSKKMYSKQYFRDIAYKPAFLREILSQKHHILL